MKKLNSKLFKGNVVSASQLSKHHGGENVGTCYGSSTLDTYDKATGACDDIKYSSASNKNDWNWTPTDPGNPVEPLPSGIISKN